MGTKRTPAPWTCRDRVLDAWPLVMGILNVTPDSFSDGGLYVDHDRAVTRAREMLDAGADIVDIGGESTRPGAAAVGADEELSRVLPVITSLLADRDAVISIDTSKAAVARAAVDAGARIINDVTACTGDSAMVDVARESGAGVILMHMLGTPRTMQTDPRYDDVVEDIARYLAGRLAEIGEGGVDYSHVAVDPGIGFGKTVEHNLALLRHLDRLGDRPVVVGLSRKSFLEKLTGREVDERLAGSLAGLVWCVLHGAHVLRVHDVAESRDAIRIATALAGGDS